VKDENKKYQSWHRVLIPVNYENLSQHSLNLQYETFANWLRSNVKRTTWKYPLTQENNYWTFYLKNKEDAVYFSLRFL